jgi:hypothetical protein
MTRNEALELLEVFKTRANEPYHLYDVYHGKPDGVHLWFIYPTRRDDVNAVASFRFEDVFHDEEYAVEVLVGQRFYQFVDAQACRDLLDTITYETID